MAVWTYAQLEGLWDKEGGDPAESEEAAAVAEAESGGDDTAKNLNKDGSIDRGLWQINSVHGNLSTFDPYQNTTSAIQISKNGANWTPWTTYQTGAYKKFLANTPADYTAATGSAMPADAQGDSEQASVTDALNPLSWLTNAFGGDVKDLSERAGLMLLGALLLFIGVHRMMGGKTSDLGSKAVNAVKKNG